MKVSITETNRKVFTPKTLTIEIESKRELEYFWSLFNMSTLEELKIINECKKDGMRDFTMEDSKTYAIWEQIDNYRKDAIQ